MKINIQYLFKGAQSAKGLVVVIDVFRAFSLAPLMIANGAKNVIPVAEKSIAYDLKKKNPDYILVGEREGKTLPGFDYGNSPTALKQVNLSGKTIIHTTSAGTQGLVEAIKNADEVLTGSFVNAQAIISYILQRKPEQVTFVAMGDSGRFRTSEDDACAEYLHEKLLGKDVNFYEMRADILQTESALKFLDETKPWFPEKDLHFCLKLNTYDFVLKVNQSTSQIALSAY